VTCGVLLIAGVSAGGSCGMQSGLGRQGVAAFTASSDIAPRHMVAKAPCSSSQHMPSGALPNTCSSEAGGRRRVIAHRAAGQHAVRARRGRVVGYGTHDSARVRKSTLVTAGHWPGAPALHRRNQPPNA
jgi:hypothetical protein